VFACPSDSGLPSPAVVQDPFSGNYYAVTSYRPNTSGLPVTDPNYQTDGVVVGFLSHLNYGTPPVRITDITDGTSNTILFGESSNFDPNWPQYASFLGSPANYPMSLHGSQWAGSDPVGTGAYPLNNPLPPSPTGTVGALWAYARAVTYGSGHTGGANFVFCDGSVHFLSNAINNTPTLLPALSTRAGGEVIDGSSF
jgi:prepilin-type processing-associated H-X9-DG protein